MRRYHDGKNVENLDGKAEQAGGSNIFVISKHSVTLSFLCETITSIPEYWEHEELHVACWQRQYLLLAFAFQETAYQLS